MACDGMKIIAPTDFERVVSFLKLIGYEDTVFMRDYTLLGEIKQKLKLIVPPEKLLYYKQSAGVKAYKGPAFLLCKRFKPRDQALHPWIFERVRFFKAHKKWVQSKGVTCSEILRQLFMLYPSLKIVNRHDVEHWLWNAHTPTYEQQRQKKDKPEESRGFRVL